jgi:exopolysaccharide biosynthesis polyprenyl glycosylphosphotransferase
LGGQRLLTERRRAEASRLADRRRAQGHRHGASVAALAESWRGSGVAGTRPGSARHRGWLVRRLLLLADLFGLVAAFAITESLVGPSAASRPYDSVGPFDESVLFLATLPVWVFVAKLYRLYDRDEERTDHSTADDIIGVFHLVTVGVWLFLAAAWVTQLVRPTFPKLVTFWILAIGLVAVARAGARALARRHGSFVQKAIIVGGGSTGRLIARKLRRHPEYGIEPVGFVDSCDRGRARNDADGLPLLGCPEDVPALVEELDVDRVIVAFSQNSYRRTLDLIRALKDYWVHVDVVPRLHELIGPGVDIHSVEGMPLVGLTPFRLSRSSKLVKRAADVTVAAVALVLLAPLFALVALAIKLDSNGPIFFRQLRMGGAGKTFQILKFRTMAVDAEQRKAEVAYLNKHARNGGDPRMFKIVGDPRVTRVGRVLRRYMLDELPQLLNVLRGEMSLVGPRPLILDEDRYVDGWARKRLDLKPGMTGLWQVLGRSEIPFEEMVKLDYVYVTSWSLWNDIRLLLRTIPLVARGEVQAL